MPYEAFVYVYTEIYYANEAFAQSNEAYSYAQYALNEAIYYRNLATSAFAAEDYDLTVYYRDMAMTYLYGTDSANYFILEGAYAMQEAFSHLQNADTMLAIY